MCAVCMCGVCGMCVGVCVCVCGMCVGVCEGEERDNLQHITME